MSAHGFCMNCGCLSTTFVPHYGGGARFKALCCGKEMEFYAVTDTPNETPAPAGTDQSAIDKAYWNLTSDERKIDVIERAYPDSPVEPRGEKRDVQFVSAMKIVEEQMSWVRQAVGN